MAVADLIRVLSLDPSSSCVGYALTVTEARDRTSPVRWGRVIPRGEDGWGRLRDLTGMVDELLSLECGSVHGPPDVAVVELPGARSPGQKGNSNAKALSVHGAAVGVVLSAVVRAGLPLVTVEAHRWTRFGRKGGMPKPDRLRMLERMDVGVTYDPARDAGGDGGDALLLGWFAPRYLWEQILLAGAGEHAVGPAVGSRRGASARAAIVRHLVGVEWGEAAGARQHPRATVSASASLPRGGLGP